MLRDAPARPVPPLPPPKPTCLPIAMHPPSLLLTAVMALREQVLSSKVRIPNPTRPELMYSA